jgi:L-asparaginase II
MGRKSLNVDEGWRQVTNTAAEPMVELWRGGLLESVHRGHAVICDDQGQIVEQNEPEEFFLNPKSERTKLFLSQILGH